MAPAIDSTWVLLTDSQTRCGMRSQTKESYPMICLYQVRKQKMDLGDRSKNSGHMSGREGAVTWKGTCDACVCDVFLCVYSKTQRYLQYLSRSRSFPKMTDSQSRQMSPGPLTRAKASLGCSCRA